MSYKIWEAEEQSAGQYVIITSGVVGTDSRAIEVFAIPRHSGQPIWTQQIALPPGMPNADFGEAELQERARESAEAAIRSRSTLQPVGATVAAGIGSSYRDAVAAGRPLLELALRGETRGALERVGNATADSALRNEVAMCLRFAPITVRPIA